MALSLDDYFLKVFDSSFLSRVSQRFFSLPNFKKLYNWEIPEKNEEYSLLDLTRALQENVNMDSPSKNLLDELIYTFTITLSPQDRYTLFIALSRTNKTLTDSDCSQLFTVKEIGSALANLCFKNLFGAFLPKESYLLFPDVWDKKKLFFQYPCSLPQILFRLEEPIGFYNGFYNNFYSFDALYAEYQNMITNWQNSIDNKFKNFRNFFVNPLFENVTATIIDFQKFMSKEKISLHQIYLILQTRLQEVYAPSKDYFSFHKKNMGYVFSIQEKESEKFFTQLDELLSSFAQTIMDEGVTASNASLCCITYIDALSKCIDTFYFQIYHAFQEYKSGVYAPSMKQHFSKFFSRFFQYELLEEYFWSSQNLLNTDPSDSPIIQEIYSFRKKTNFKKDEREYSPIEQNFLNSLFKNILLSLKNEEIPPDLQTGKNKISDQIQDRFDIPFDTNISQGALTEIQNSRIITYFPFLVFSYISSDSEQFTGSELKLYFNARNEVPTPKNAYRQYQKCLQKVFSVQIDNKKESYTISELEYKIFLFSRCIDICYKTTKKLSVKIDVDYLASSVLFLWSVSGYIPDSREILEISTLENYAPIIGHINDSFEIGSPRLFHYMINRLCKADLSSFCKKY